MPFTSLSRHPSSTAAPAIRIEAAVLLLAEESVSFRYRVSGDIGRIRLPAERTGLRTDNLWRHTCFEAFISNRGEDSYVELNFSPSAAWAAYSFESYRTGMKSLDSAESPTIECRTDGTTLTLDAAVRLGSPHVDMAVGLAAVIEDIDGGVSYWALAHPRARPDFHDATAWTSKLERRRTEDRS